MSASDRQKPLHFACLRAFGPTLASPGFPELQPRTWGSSGSFWRGFRHASDPHHKLCMYVIVRVKPPERDMHDGVKIRHRPGPLSDPVPAIRRHKIRGRSGGRLNLLVRKDWQARRRSHAGHRLLTGFAARYGRSRKAFLPPEPKRSRSIRQRERHECGMGVEGGDEMARKFSVIALCHRHAGPRSGIQRASVREPVSNCIVMFVWQRVSRTRRSGRCWIPDQVRDDGGGCGRFEDSERSHFLALFRSISRHPRPPTLGSIPRSFVILDPVNRSRNGSSARRPRMTTVGAARCVVADDDVGLT